jgi:hypothetical protein
MREIPESPENSPVNEAARMANPHVFIATPMYGGMCTGHYCSSLVMALFALSQRGIQASYQFLYNESLISRARNTLTSFFLDSEATHLMFIDADINFRPEDLIRMIDADLDILCGVYPKKGINWNTVGQAARSGVPDGQLQHFAGQFVLNLAGNADEVAADKDVPLEIWNGGTGFMLIRREVFERLEHAVPEYSDEELANVRGGKVREFFSVSVDPETRQLLSEDYFFCKLARSHGIKVHAALWAHLDHVGTYVFTGNPIVFR